MRSVVDLPQPDGPTSTTNSLSAMSRSMPRTASVLSKRLTILRANLRHGLSDSCASVPAIGSRFSRHAQPLVAPAVRPAM